MSQSLFPIIYEDDDILVINKPAGVVVNEAESVHVETVQGWMKKYLKEQAAAGKLTTDDWYSMIPDDFTEEYGNPQEIFASRNGIVHRLDKDTSGVLVLAKNPGALVGLMHQFKVRETRKEYTCLVHGALSVKKDKIKMPMMRSMTNRSKFQVSASGKPAETEYEVVAQYSFPREKLVPLLRLHDLERGRTDAQLVREYESYGEFSLLHAFPKTGRTHQIRVHFAFLQHALVADQVYTNKWRGRADLLWCPRQFLHASSITFQHPRSKETITVEAPLDDELQAALNSLEKKQA